MTISFINFDNLPLFGPGAQKLFRKIVLGGAEIFLFSDDTAIDKFEMQAALHPNEIFRMNSMKSDKRSLEFLRSRYMMHKLLSIESELVGEKDGVIRWPEGKTCSLSHKDGMIAFAILEIDKLHSEFCGIGIDLEGAFKVHLGIESRIINAAESLLIDDLIKKKLDGVSREMLLSLAFSIKESLFKAIYPIGRIFFYFHKAEILALDIENQTCNVRIKDDLSFKTPTGTELEGYFAFLTNKRQTLILSLITI